LASARPSGVGAYVLGTAPHIMVGPPTSERFDVPQFSARSYSAAGRFGRTGERIRAAHAAGWIGGRGQFADQRRAVRSGQSQRAQRPQRHRQRVEDSAAWYKRAAAAARLRTDRFITVTRGRALRGRVTERLQCRSGPLKKAPGPPSRPQPGTGQQIYGDLPGLLAPLISRKAASAMRSDLSASVLARADEVIE
jgi:hypothetical protein